MKATDFGVRADHFGIHTYDRDKSIQWFGDIFGFELEKAIGLPAGHFPRAAFDRLGDFFFEVYEVRNALPVTYESLEQTIGVKMAGLACTDFAGWKANALEKGVEFVYEDNTPGKEEAVIKDDNGILYEVVVDEIGECDEFLRGPKWGMRVHHIYITCYNAKETAKWYHDAFGYEPVEAPARTSFTTAKIEAITLRHVEIRMVEVPDADAFNLYDFENIIGIKHIDYGMMDRQGWCDYTKDCGSRIPVIVSCGHPSIAHYVTDNNLMLTEMSEDQYYFGMM